MLLKITTTSKPETPGAWEYRVVFTTETGVVVSLVPQQVTHGGDPNTVLQFDLPDLASLSIVGKVASVTSHESGESESK